MFSWVESCGVPGAEQIWARLAIATPCWRQSSGSYSLRVEWTWPGSVSPTVPRSRRVERATPLGRLPRQHLVEHLERAALPLTFHQSTPREDQRRRPLTHGQAVTTESCNVDDIDPATADSLPPNGPSSPGAARRNAKPHCLAWSSSRVAITTSGLSTPIGHYPIPPPVPRLVNPGRAVPRRREGVPPLAE
jgi:hypothetical protein